MQKRAIKTKNRILKTAIKLFSEHGFNGVTVDEIAGKAGVNKQRIYPYFENKAGLFEACLVEVFSEINKNETGLLNLTDRDIPELTGKIMSHYLSNHKSNPRFWRLIAWANLEPDPFYKCLKNIKEQSFSRIRELYLKGQDENIFQKNTSFETYIFTLMGISFFYFSNQKTLKFSLSEELFTEKGMNSLIEETKTIFSVSRPGKK